MQDIISTLKNALQQAEAGLEVAVGRLAKDGTERGDFKPSEVLALACVREALAMPVSCLHQIQEPAAAEQAAWHSGLDEGRAQAAQPSSVSNAETPQAAPAAVAVPDDRAAFERELIDNHHYVPSDFSFKDGFYNGDDDYIQFGWDVWQARAALAATPAAEVAAPVLVDDMKQELMALYNEIMKQGRGMHYWNYAAAVLARYRGTLATPLAAAPVVLPEPDFHVRPASAVQPHRALMIWDNDATSEQAYFARTVRALLATATGLPAQAVEPSDAELIALNAGECFFSESPSKYPELGHGTQYHGGAPGVIGFARAALALRADPAAYSQKFQQRVQPWMMTCFGPEISADRRERNHRFLEEALELLQSCGCTASEAHQLVDYVYGRPWGEPAQEAGGVMVTLAALCLANDLDMHACAETELARIWTKVEAIRAKQAAKPKHSPLPEHAPQAQADARDADVLAWLLPNLHPANFGLEYDGDKLDADWNAEFKRAILAAADESAAIAAEKGESE